MLRKFAKVKKNHLPRYTFLVIGLILFSTTTIAQNLDSLWNIWQDDMQADTTRLEAIHKIAWNGYLFTQPDSAFYFAQLQHDFAQSIGLREQMTTALNTQGISYAVRGNYPQALEYYQKSLELDIALDNKKGIAGSLNNIGLVYRNQGNNDKALRYFEKSLLLYEELDHKNRIALMMNNIGIIYYDQRNFSKALEYYQKSLAIQEARNDEKGVAISLNNMGLIYQDQGNTAKALEYGKRSLAIKEKLGNKLGIASSLHNIGLIYQDQGKTAKALEYCNQSLQIQEELGNKKGMANVLNNIGRIYQQKGNRQEALRHCKNGYELSKSIQVLEEQKNACQCLYDIYKSNGNGNEALVFLELLNVVEDSLNAKETAKKLQQMEFAKQVLADSLANAEEARLIEEAHRADVRKKNQFRNVLIGAGLFLLLIVGGVYSRLKYTRKAKALVEKEKDRSENLLLNILPAEIAAELKEKGRAEARAFEQVSILFTDFKEFTAVSEQLSPHELVSEINTCFEAFDRIIEQYGIEKIKTIGDAYMAAGGLPIPSQASVKHTVLAALAMQNFITERKRKLDAAGKPGFEMRVGIHTGLVVAGIVGVKKFQYDIWGDTVNIASRMESASTIGKVNISQATYELLRENPQFQFDKRGKVTVKGKGEIEMYFVRVSD